MRIIVVVESPFMGKGRTWLTRRWSGWLNKRYARAAVRDCILRGEAPFASHLLYTQPGILRDEDPLERRLGIDVGHEFMRFAGRVVVYTDRGVSRGMEEGMVRARAAGLPVIRRSLPLWSKSKPKRPARAF
jgi:hypothetical protein